MVTGAGAALCVTTVQTEVSPNIYGSYLVGGMKTVCFYSQRTDGRDVNVPSLT